VKVEFRDARDAEDSKFALESWLEGQRTSYSAGLVPVDCWFEVMRPMYSRLMKRDGMRTMVAYEAADRDFLYGTIIADPTEQAVPSKGGGIRYWPALVLWVFVKVNFRKEGIARGLFEAVGIDVTRPFLYSSNTVTASRLASKTPLAKFDPLAARFPKNDNR
jgi:hypothetical protein